MKRFAFLLAVPAIVGIVHLAGGSSSPDTAFSEHPTPQSLGITVPANPIAVRQAANVTYTGGYTAPTLDPALNVDLNCCVYSGPAIAVAGSTTSGAVRHHAAYSVSARCYPAHTVAAHTVKAHTTKKGTFVAGYNVPAHVRAAYCRKAYTVAAR